ncbi:hypothetical protein [Burkholderia multivorans]|uniref:hypothetical protein n=1 Tax=Burkholderia multivorans TaxID=87883 RepID=UPI0013A07D73|nr:hypothetical protein [Burkholderia multivorans]
MTVGVDRDSRSIGTKRSPLPCCATYWIEVVDAGKLRQVDAQSDDPPQTADSRHAGAHATARRCMPPLAQI